MEIILGIRKMLNRNLYLFFVLVGVFILLMSSGCSGREDSADLIDEPVEAQVTEQVMLNDHIIQMELAVTPEQREQGLMGRESLADGEGMLFVMPDEDPFPTEVGFWMKDCLIPIDLIFISREGFIDSIHEMQPPEPDTPDHELTVYYSNGPVQFAIELRGGLAAEIGLNVGDSVDLRKDYLLQLAE